MSFKCKHFEVWISACIAHNLWQQNYTRTHAHLTGVSVDNTLVEKHNVYAILVCENKLTRQKCSWQTSHRMDVSTLTVATERMQTLHHLHTTVSFICVTLRRTNRVVFSTRPEWGTVFTLAHSSGGWFCYVGLCEAPKCHALRCPLCVSCLRQHPCFVIAFCFRAYIFSQGSSYFFSWAYRSARPSSTKTPVNVYCLCTLTHTHDVVYANVTYFTREWMLNLQETKSSTAYTAEKGQWLMFRLCSFFYLNHAYNYHNYVQTIIPAPPSQAQFQHCWSGPRIMRFSLFIMRIAVYWFEKRYTFVSVLVGKVYLHSVVYDIQTMNLNTLMYEHALLQTSQHIPTKRKLNSVKASRVSIIYRTVHTDSENQTHYHKYFSIWMSMENTSAEHTTELNEPMWFVSMLL